MYFGGEGVGQSLERAFFWWLRAAENGHAKGQFLVGAVYGAQGNDEAARYDPAEVLRWRRKSAEQRFASAQFNVAHAFYKGTTVRKSHTMAASWYRRAAAQGFVRAQIASGTLYYRGEGVQRNRGNAAKWFCLAADQSSDRARRPPHADGARPTRVRPGRLDRALLGGPRPR